MHATHATTTNGRIHEEFTDPEFSPDELIRRYIDVLDGTTDFSLGLWALPPGVPLGGFDIKTWPQEYIQTAGSRDRLIVEIRRIIHGTPTLYAIGHLGYRDLDQADQATETVVWDGIGSVVPANEVFDATETAALFLSYFRTDDIPAGYTLRTLNL